MFGFLFKRSSKTVPPTPEKQKIQEKDEASAMAAEKAAATAKAQSLGGDETAAAEFVLQCRIADARLQAANHVHSKELLEKLVVGMRDTDRRVLRLAQQRLDALKQKEDAERKAGMCLTRLQSLAKETVILPNQISDIERSWNALHDVPQELVDQFEQVRAALQQRLLEQTGLQRGMIALRASVQLLMRELEEALPSSSMDPASARLDSLSEKFSRFCASPEASSLPKNLVSESATMLDHARRLLSQLARRQAAIAAHEQAYSAWEAASGMDLDIDTLRRELRSLQPLSADDAQLFNQRLERLQARFAKPVPSPLPPANAKHAKADMSKFRELLEALERALEEGVLQLAVEHEKELRAAESLDLRWKDEEISRLAKARAELSRLKGWARWGGQVSREELVKTAEELPGKEASPPELAKKIGSLRSQWKSMDATAGPADKAMWLRFDAACTTAYAPVAAYFNALAAERKENLEKAQLLISQVRDFAASENAAAETGAIDWKRIAGCRSRMSQAWHAIGTIDRKEKKALEKQFADAISGLTGPLADAQQEEIKRREDLIAQVMQLDPADRKSMDLVRRLQQQWQQQAKSLPLERKDEQALWIRFRAACDEHVARRKAGQQQHDAQHQENYRLKSALCERLESQADGHGKEAEVLLKGVEQEWRAIGPVPRTNEQALHERYKRAVSGVQSGLARERQAARREQFERVQKKLDLCIVAEQEASAGMPKDVSELEERWRLCGPLPDAFERILHARFQAASSALRCGDMRFGEILKENCAELERALLRMEINLEVESPPELTGKRLKLQVEALQASLKSGGAAIDRTTMLIKLCELPALHDDASRARMARLVERFGTIGS
jgi:DNA repair protein SbcC/Rad50